MRASVMLMLASLTLCRAANSFREPEDGPAAFLVHYLEYGTNGVLQPSTRRGTLRTTSFFYGGPVTNVTFSTELPASPSAAGAAQPDEDGGVFSASRVPARSPNSQFHIDRWTAQHGLPGNRVRALFQTKDGYLWIGTSHGLARFDGARFSVFPRIENTIDSDGGYSVRAFYENENGQLWIGTDDGLFSAPVTQPASVLHRETEWSGSVNDLEPRSGGGFWIAGDEGVGFYDGKQIHRWVIPDLGHALSVAEGTDMLLWIGTQGTLVAFDMGSQRVTQAFFKERLDFRTGKPDINTYDLLLDDQRRLWVGSNHGVWRIDASGSMPISLFGSNQGGITIPTNARFAADAQRRVWATTQSVGGVLRLLDGPSGTVREHFAQEIGETLCILIDREGAIWAGGTHGLFRLRRVPFATVTFDGITGRVSARFLHTAWDGSLWFANTHVFARWSGSDITLFDVIERQGTDKPVLCDTPSGRVWAIRRSPGIFELPSSENDLLWQQPAPSRFPEIGDVRAMITTRDGYTWIATAQGLYRSADMTAVDRAREVSEPDIRVLLEDHLANLWIGTVGGKLLRLRAGHARAWTSEDGWNPAPVTALRTSGDGTLWIGTEAGLRRLQNEQVVEFDASSGLPERPIQGILEDQFRRLWLSHDAGVSRVGIDDLELWLDDRSRKPAIAYFGTDDGLKFVQGAIGPQTCAKTADGRLWFAKGNGIAVVDPAECPPGMPAPRVWIEEVIIDGESSSIEEISELKSSDARSVEFRFTATCLSYPDRALIRYQLDGHDPDWREAGTIRKATYANLPPGSYRFRVQARNHEGRWSEREAALAFRIIPPFWRTWPFYTGCVVLTLAAGVGLVRWRVQEHRHQFASANLEALEKERARIARDMHDHLGAHLALASLASDRANGKSEFSHESLDEFNDLIWSIQPKNDSLPRLADFFADFAMRYLGVAGIRFDLDFPEKFPPTPISSHSRRDVAAMFKEALRNVVQHARASQVAIRVRVDENHLALRIRDDGRGFEFCELNANAGACRSANRGAGLRNFRERAEALGGTARIESSPGKGTSVQFLIPLDESKPNGRSRRSWFHWSRIPTTRTKT